MREARVNLSIFEMIPGTQDNRVSGILLDLQ